MRLRQFSLIFLTTTSLVVLTGRWANAITLTGATEGYDISVPLQGSTLTAHGDRISLLARPSSDFMTTLTSLFQGWTFTPAQSDLPGAFNVDYFVPYIQPGQTASGQPTVDAGADIQLRYISPPLNVSLAGSTPAPDPNKLHWIQRVTKFNLTGRKGVPNNFIDVPSGESTPYYDRNPGINLPNQYTFKDTPGKVRPQAPNTVIVDTFVAQLFLVEETAPKTVKIYNGLSWSWQNTFTPTPPISLPPIPCTGGSGGGGCPTVAS